MNTVILGLSGGVDSLVSALLLKEQGYKVIACTFKLWQNESSIESARALAHKLDLEFRIIDIKNAFKNQIIDPFIADYISGETPNPCVWCNNEIKAYYLYQEMIKSESSYFATGHYINIKKDKSNYYIHRGIDHAKDQSYFLWNVRAQYLKHWLTPLGGLKKTEVKQIAIEHKMGFLAHKKESMGICFIPDTGYHQFLDKHKSSEQKISKGKIVDKDNKTLGEHDGIPYYTIGQKKGLEILEKGLAVSKIDAINNKLIVGTKQELYCQNFKVKSYYFIDEQDIYNQNIYVWVRGLGRNPEGYCKIAIIDKETLNVELEGQAWALAKGQPVAFYIEDKLIGGGYIH